MVKSKEESFLFSYESGIIRLNIKKCLLCSKRKLGELIAMDTASIPFDMPVLHIHLLGTFTLTARNICIQADESRSLKLQSVLAYFLLHRERAISQAELIEYFWSQDNNANPYSALKTTLYRIRSMLQPLLGKSINPILSQRGAYRWNEQIPCEMDIHDFEYRYQQAANPCAPIAARIADYGQVLSLYRGDLLPRLSDQHWILPVAAHYRLQYIESAKALADLLEQTQNYAQMHEVAVRASAIAPLEEGLHARIIRALIAQNENAAALKHYEMATRLLYRNLKVRPSEELRALYQEIMHTAKNAQLNLHTIAEDLHETAAREGAYFCPYGSFREIYRLECRRFQRNAIPIFLLLITVLLPDGTVPMPSQMLSDAMQQLQDALLQTLRSGDVVTQYSGMQYAVMLPDCTQRGCTVVANRIQAAISALPSMICLHFDSAPLTEI